MADNFRRNAGAEEAYKFDPLHHAATTVHAHHRMVHDGMMFHCTDRVADLANAANYDLLFTIPEGVFPHITKILWHLEGAPMDIKVYETPTTSAAGTAVTAFNVNRNSSKVGGASLTHTPTVTGVGTLIHDAYIPTAGKDVGSFVEALGEEWMFKPNTSYLIRLTNNSGAISDLSFEFMWYELSYDQP